MAELADVIRAVADGGQQVAEQDLTVVLPPDDRSVGVMAFAGHNVVSVDLAQDLVRQWLPGDDLGAPLSPPFLGVLAGATGRSPDNLDLVLVAPATGRPNGMDFSELTEFVEPLPPRLARALAQRIGVRAWRCPGGLVTLGRGVAGRWEVSVEVDSTLRGFGLGRALFTAARGLLPADEHVWAQVAPGNAASVRAALAAGFRPVGAEVLLHATKITFGPFGWFDALDEPEPEPEPDLAREPDDLDGRDDPDEILEQAQADEILDRDGGQVGDLADADVAAAQPLSVSDKPSSENEPINSDG